MTLTVRLEPEDDKKLDEIVRDIGAGDRSSAIRQIIDEKWRSLQEGTTFLERRGGHPVNLLNGTGDSSTRDVRKNTMAKAFEAKAAARRRTK